LEILKIIYLWYVSLVDHARTISPMRTDHFPYQSLAKTNVDAEEAYAMGPAKWSIYQI
jgi:hypothetical protein